jgi:hypothetical protein
MRPRCARICVNREIVQVGRRTFISRPLGTSTSAPRRWFWCPFAFFVDDPGLMRSGAGPSRHFAALTKRWLRHQSDQVSVAYQRTTCRFGQTANQRTDCQVNQRPVAGLSELPYRAKPHSKDAHGYHRPAAPVQRPRRSPRCSSMSTLGTRPKSPTVKHLRRQKSPKRPRCSSARGHRDPDHLPPHHLHGLRGLRLLR